MVGCNAVDLIRNKLESVDRFNDELPLSSSCILLRISSASISGNSKAKQETIFQHTFIFINTKFSFLMCRKLHLDRELINGFLETDVLSACTAYVSRQRGPGPTEIREL